MKWITRERTRVDRIAYPWLISHFIDPRPELIFVPASGQPIESWDVPNISDGYDAARNQIVDKVERLVAGVGGR